MIQFDHLTKEYDGIPAVKDLTTEIHSGEIFGLLGPNSAGKSTTILMLIAKSLPDSDRNASGTNRTCFHLPPLNSSTITVINIPLRVPLR